MRKRDLSIKSKLIIILSVFVIISTVAIAYSILNIKDQKSDALIINLAGRQRALVQAMSKSVLGLHNAAEDEDTAERARRVEFYQKDLIAKRKLFNETLAALMDGGAVTDGDDSLVTVPRTRDLALRVKLEESKALWEGLASRIDLVLAGFSNTKDKEVNAAIRYVEENNAELFKDMNKLTMMFQAASDTKLKYFKNVLYAGILLNLAAFAAVIWLTNRLVLKRLESLHAHMTDITRGEGDLTRRIDVLSNDEIGALGSEFNRLLENFELIISKLIGSCALLQESSRKLSGNFSAMAEGINRQDQKTNQVATAMEEMSATVIEVAKNASNMTETARRAELAARSGGASVDKVVARMNEIAASTRRSVKIVASLGAESEKIGNIVQVINEIADQTNLLALNAAIEAARAGDQGRGFAVVADEVRKLAERTTRSTKEIYEMISGIQSESRKAVESIESESTSVEEGVGLTKEAGAALAEINSSINEVAGLVQQIATSTEEQSAVAGTISADMEAVASISNDSSNGVREVNELAGELDTLATEIEKTLSKFKVSSGTAAAAEEVEVIDLGSKSVSPLKTVRLASNG